MLNFENLQKPPIESCEDEVKAQNVESKSENVGNRDIEKKFDDFSLRGEEGIKRVMEKSGLSPEELVQATQDFGIFKKINELNHWLKRAILVASVSLSFSYGFGQKNEGGNDIELNHQSSQKQKLEQDQEQQEKIVDLFKLFKLIIDQKKAHEKSIKLVDEARQELLAHLGSQEFLKKLTIEHEGNTKKAKMDQKKRIDNLKKAKVEVLPTIDMYNLLIKKGVPSDNAMRSLGRYFYKEHKIIIPQDEQEGFEMLADKLNCNFDFVKKDNLKKTIKHEFLHAATRGNKQIFPETAKTLKKAYSKDIFEIFNDKSESQASKEYHHILTERLVRKQILDLDLQELGIKKYGEEFNDEHYKKILDVYEEGSLSSDSMDFIERTSPKRLKKIMNNIAENPQVANRENSASV